MPNSNEGAGPVSSASRIGLPEAFGSSISTDLLDKLRSLRNDFRPFPAKIALARDGAYRDGEELKIVYHSDLDAFYVVLYRDPRGNYSVVMPSKRDRVTLAGGKGYVFPEEPGEHLIVRPPACTATESTARERRCALRN